MPSRKERKARAAARAERRLIPAGLMQEIPVSRLTTRSQVRKRVDEQALQDLARTVRERGVLQPLLVTKGAGPDYLVVVGERRLRAARLAGLRRVPCVVVAEKSPAETLEAQLVENIQREDLDPLDEATAVKALMDASGLTQAEVGRRLGKSQSWVAKRLGLLDAPEPLREMVASGALSPAAAVEAQRVARDRESAEAVKERLGPGRATVARVKRVVAELANAAPDQTRVQETTSAPVSLPPGPSASAPDDQAVRVAAEGLARREDEARLRAEAATVMPRYDLLDRLAEAVLALRDTLRAWVGSEDGVIRLDEESREGLRLLLVRLAELDGFDEAEEEAPPPPDGGAALMAGDPAPPGQAHRPTWFCTVMGTEVTAGVCRRCNERMYQALGRTCCEHVVSGEAPFSCRTCKQADGCIMARENGVCS